MLLFIKMFFPISSRFWKNFFPVQIYMVPGLYKSADAYILSFSFLISDRFLIACPEVSLILLNSSGNLGYNFPDWNSTRRHQHLFAAVWYEF